VSYILTFAILAVGLAAIRIFQLYSVWRKLMKQKIRIVPPKLAENDSPPGELSEVYAAASKALGEQGFVYSHSLSYIGMFSGETALIQVYFHSPSRSYALVSPRRSLLALQSFQTTYTSYLSDGSVAFTTDWMGDIQLDHAPGHFQFDGFSGNLDAQWKLHQESAETIRASHGGGFAQFVPQEHAEVEARLMQEDVEFWKKECFEVQDDRPVAFKRKEAWRAAKFLLKANDRRRKSAKTPILPTVSVEAYVQADTALFSPMLKEQKKSQTIQKKFWLFTATIVISAVAFGLLYSWDRAPLILLVLFIHELGHWAGMRIFRYRDTSIFFVPLIGALTVGKNEEATPMQKLTVYLLGPVPGLLIGLVLIWVPSPVRNPLFYSAGLMFLIINYLNLLPITPLDGGRIMELIISHRFPRAQVTLIALSALALISATVFFHEQFTGVLGILLLFSLPNTWRTQKYMRALRPEIARLPDKEGLVEAIISFTYRSPLVRKISGGRFSLVKQLYTLALAPVPTRSDAFKGIGLYVLSLAFPLIGTFALAFLSYHFAAKGPNWEEKLATVHSPAERRDVLLEAAEWFHYESEDTDSAVVYYRRALAVADNARLTDDQTVKVLRGLAFLEKDSVVARAHLTRALNEARQLHGPAHSEVAEVLEQFGSQWINVTTHEEKVRCLRQAIGIRDTLGQTTAKANTQQMLAILHFRQGELAPAESLFVLCIQSLDTVPLATFNFVSSVHWLAELYERSGRSALALSLLERSQPRAGDTSKGGAVMNVLELASHYGWIALRQKDTALADDTFRKNIARAKSLKSEYDLSYLTSQYILDLCSLELARGHRQEAIEQFVWVKKKVSSRLLRMWHGKGNQSDTIVYSDAIQRWRDLRAKAHAHAVDVLLASD
jgi:tetratricopeptide (TPR) repeat protein/Zn-dependent protease